MAGYGRLRSQSVKRKRYVVTVREQIFRYQELIILTKYEKPLAVLSKKDNMLLCFQIGNLLGYNKVRELFIVEVQKLPSLDYKQLPKLDCLNQWDY
ncbi:hypothetical protein AVEN_213551-1 [Araneus ventricosus]|uniref:Uncharacterized protein n=1 Tax=Araneus ventricosus TaxID=182803 RepID=A0A4Y2HJ19_ARAVE|nr:hypothetical protein AVEN_213551-1 [Araneus ventricosus]